jgi:hypothetical protein
MASEKKARMFRTNGRLILIFKKYQRFSRPQIELTMQQNDILPNRKYKYASDLNNRKNKHIFGIVL